MYPTLYNNATCRVGDASLPKYGALVLFTPVPCLVYPFIQATTQKRQARLKQKRPMLKRKVKKLSIQVS